MCSTLGNRKISIVNIVMHTLGIFSATCMHAFLEMHVSLEMRDSRESRAFNKIEI